MGYKFMILDDKEVRRLEESYRVTVHLSFIYFYKAPYTYSAQVHTLSSCSKVTYGLWISSL